MKLSARHTKTALKEKPKKPETFTTIYFCTTLALFGIGYQIYPKICQNIISFHCFMTQILVCPCINCITCITLSVCLCVRYQWHSAKSPLFPKYTGLSTRVHPCLDSTLIDYSRLDYSWLDNHHLDYLWCLDYRRWDYFRLQGHLDYKDIWTTPVWTTPVWTILDYRVVWTPRTFGLQGHLDYRRFDY